jgi:hypothetical protein
MNPWLAAYMCIYLALSVGGVWSDIKSRYSFWWVALDAFSGTILFTGMLLVLFNIQVPLLKAVWLPLTAACLVVIVGLLGLDFYDCGLKETSEPGDWKLAIISTILMTLFEIPAFVVNLSYAGLK